MRGNGQNEQAPNGDPFVSVAKAARLLGLSRATVLARIAAGKLDSQVIAERPVVTRESLDRLIAEQSAEARVA